MSYFVLAFAISWGIILIAVGLGSGGFSATPQQLQVAIPYAVPALFAGPGIAGLMLTGVVSGRAGFRNLGTRLLKWRVGARWYAIALLTAPLLIMAVLLALSLISPQFLPRIFTTSDTASLLLMGLAVALPTGILEELGWTGFATPRMRLRYGVLGAGLIVGMLWGAWHLPINYWASGVTSAEVSLYLGAPVAHWHIRRATHGLQGVDGLGLRAHRWEPAGSDPHARKPHSLRDHSLPTAGSGSQFDQWFHLCRRDVAGRRGHRHSSRRPPVATARS